MMATYRHSGRHSIDKNYSSTTNRYGKYFQDEEKAYSATIVTESDSQILDRPPETAKDLVTEVIHAVDDPSLNPVDYRSK